MIKGRESLKSQFTDKSIPTSQEFSDLIDSVLVKRDDAFFGKFVPGMGYQPGDVVVDQNSFYVFLSAAEALALNPNCDCGDDCCDGKRPEECCRWQKVQVTTDDGDWVRFDDTTMFARVYGKVGIGTDNNPGAFFHLNDANNSSQWKFNPQEDGIALPMLKMIKSAAATPPPGGNAPKDAVFVSQQIEKFHPPAGGGPKFCAGFETDTLGYLFKKVGGGATPGTEESMSLLFIGSTPERPRIGIGTNDPQAALEVSADGKGQILLDPGDGKDPAIKLVNLQTGGKNHYLTVMVGGARASFTTDAPYGFAFRRVIEPPAGKPHEKEEKTLAVIDIHGNLRAGGLYVDPIPKKSDLEVKQIREALQTVRDLEPLRFKENGEQQFGFFAENIIDNLPQAFKQFPDHKEGIGYHDLVVLLVKAVQELSTEVHHLKKRISDWE